jgi:lysophospholipase L1-like esterase
MTVARWLLALCFLSSCGGMSTPDAASEAPAATTTASAPSNGKYFAIGDSYTIGESVAPEDRFPHQLARELGMPEPLIVAKTGWTTDELGNALDTIRVAGPYDLVTLLIGVNNQYRGRDAEQYRGEFAELLRRAIGFAGDDASKVIVVSIPDWGVTPFAEGRDRAKIASEIDRYNAINREETARAGARYVDITPVSRGSDPALVAGDGLHPSGKQYGQWVKLILPEARAALR